MEVGRQECPPGHAWSLYLLDRTVIHYVESGKGTYVCSGKTFHLKKGDAFYIPTHTRGRYQADEADPWRYTWIYFGGNTGDKFYEDLGLSKAAPIYTSSNPELVNESIGRLEQQAAAGGTYAVMPELFIRMNELIEKGDIPAARAIQYQADRIIYKMCEAHGNLYAVQKEILRRMYGLELGGVRAPLPNLIPEDEAVVAEAQKMIEEAIAKL